MFVVVGNTNTNFTSLPLLQKAQILHNQNCSLANFYFNLMILGTYNELQYKNITVHKSLNKMNILNIQL